MNKITLENHIATYVPLVPTELKEKINFTANYAMNEKEALIFVKVLKSIVEQMKIDNIDFTTLTRIGVIFTENGNFSFIDECDNTYGRCFSLAVYKLGRLRIANNDDFTLFVFAEELVHHYWQVEDETVVKYKVLEVAQRIKPSITLEKIKGWGLYGL